MSEDQVYKVAKEDLQKYIDRLEAHIEEKKEIQEEISEIYKEMKSNGYNTKAVKSVIRLRALSSQERQEEESIFQLYKDVIGI